MALRDEDGVLDSSTMPFSSLHAMTSGNLAVLAQGIGIPTRHFVGGSGKAWTLRDYCFVIIARVIRVEVELRTLRS